MGLDVGLIIEVDTGGQEPYRVELFSGNITHNLNVMAKEAGIYKHLWRPEEIDIKTAGELIEPLETALEAMKEDPDLFKEHNPPNGWGDYEGFLSWIEKYLEACRRHPRAKVEACR